MFKQQGVDEMWDIAKIFLGIIAFAFVILCIEPCLDSIMNNTVPEDIGAIIQRVKNGFNEANK